MSRTRSVALSDDDIRALSHAIDLVRDSENFNSHLEKRDILVPLEDVVARFHETPDDGRPS